MKVTHMPKATGKSMLMRPCFKSRQAAMVKTSVAKNITGKVSTHEAHFKSDNMLGAMSPGAATYTGHAYIMTCIMHRPATNQRQSC